MHLISITNLREDAAQYPDADRAITSGRLRQRETGLKQSSRLSGKISKKFVNLLKMLKPSATSLSLISREITIG
jgi:hypothetical protein